MSEVGEDPLREATAQRRRLAELLRRLRADTGLNQTEFGARLGRNQSWVSRCERGQVPSLDDARAWAEAARAGGDTVALLLERVEAAMTEAASWTDELRHGFAAKQQRISRAEQAASLVRCYSLVVPGLLQTAEYARRLIAMGAQLQPHLFADLSAAVTAWVDRQRVLYEPDGRFQFIVPESALHWRPGPNSGSVLVAQLHQLVTLSQLGSVSFGVIPLDIGASMYAPHEFVILGDHDPEDGAEVVVYTTTRDLHIRDREQIGVYESLWELLSGDALWEDDARTLLSDLAARLRHR